MYAKPIVLGATLLMGGCLGGFPTDACTTSAECRSAFGIDQTCADDGFCEAIELPARCDGSWPDDVWIRPQNYGDALVIGSLFDLGPDLPNVKSAALAIREAHESQPIGGRSVVFLTCDYQEHSTFDDLSFQEAAEQGAEWLTGVLDAQIILGAGSSSQSLAVYEALAGTDTLLIAPSSTSPLLSELDPLPRTDASPGLFWRTAPPDQGQAAAIAADMIDGGHTDVGILYQEGPYGEGLGPLVSSHLDDAGVNTATYPFNDDNSRNAAIAAVGASSAQVVLFVGSEVQDVVSFLNAIALIDDFDAKAVYLTDSANDTYLLEETTAEAQTIFPRLRGSRPQTPEGPIYDAFTIAYASAYDGESPLTDGWNAYAYDAGWLAMMGLTSGLADPEGLSGTSAARGLRKLSSGQAFNVGPLDWPAASDSLSAGTGVDLTGASGPLDFDDATGDLLSPIQIWVVNAEGTGFDVTRTCTPEGDCVDE